MKKGLIFGLMLVMLFSFSVTAKAAIVLNDWTLDLSSLYVGGPVISDVQQIAFFGVAHSETVIDNDPVGIPSVGDLSVVDGRLAGTNLINKNGIIIGPATSRMNIDWEMTFDFTIAAQTVAVAGPNVNLAHINPAILGVDGYLDIYLDTAVDANAGSGLGYTNGTHVARLIDDATGFGVFTPVSFDGSDDATFTTDCPGCFLLPGFFFADVDGVPGLEDLATIPENTLALTDSNFDADPTDQGFFSVPAPTSWNTEFPADRQTAGSPTGFFALEDGSARLAVETIPEPATLLLIGSGLLGLGFYRRKK